MTDSRTKRRKAAVKFISGQDFRRWRKSRHLTSGDVGSWLGVSSSAIQKFEQRGATKMAALALSAIDRGLGPWTPASDQEKENDDVPSGNA